METRLEIKNTSQELFLEALKTLVLPPQRAEIGFAYKGITPSRGVYEGVPNYNRYFSDCKKQGIIPINMSFKYDHNEDFFFPETSELVLLANMIKPDENAKARNECFVAGGKINTLSFEIDIPAKKGLKTFLETEADKLLEQKYELSELNLVFSFSDEDNVAADTNMFSFGDTLDLKLGIRLEKKDIAKLGKWFKNLQKKYEK